MRCDEMSGLNPACSCSSVAALGCNASSNANDGHVPLNVIAPNADMAVQLLVVP